MKLSQHSHLLVSCACVPVQATPFTHRPSTTLKRGPLRRAWEQSALFLMPVRERFSRQCDLHKRNLSDCGNICSCRSVDAA